jgi:DNA-binding Lrp family transcriptional regulator
MSTKRSKKTGIAHNSTGEAGPGRFPAASGGGSPLDAIDLAIVNYLDRHGRATNYEVGEAAGISASAVSRRILALEESGVISGYRAEINDRLLGRRMTVFVRITLERQSAGMLANFEAAVRRLKNVISCHLMAGQYDYMLVARVGGMEDYGRLHQQELSRLPGVTRLETSFAMRDVLEGR